MTTDASQPAGAAVAAGPRPEGPGVVRTSSELQMIRDRDGATVGYELFYRDSQAARSASERNTAATLRVLAGLTAPMRSRQPARTHLYFVNVTRDFLVGRVGLPNPSEIAVLEIQPDVYADAAVRRGCGELRDRGYGIALDRFVPGRDNHHDDLLPLASHVKVDMSGGDEAGVRAAVRLVRERCNAQVVACRIGSPALLDLAGEIGCDLFQGHALDGAERHTQQSVAGSLRAYVRLLELLAPEDHQVDLRQVTEVVMGDADLSTRVLRACNAAGSGTVRQITSIQQAVVLLGVHQLRQRVHLAVAQGLEVGNEAQLTQLVEYAALTELVGVELGVPAGTGFLAGLLTQVAAALQTSVGQLLDDLPLGAALAQDLRHRRGPVGRAIDTVAAYQRGEGQDGGVPQGLDLPALHARAQLAAAGVAGSLGDLSGPAAPVALPPVALPPVGGPEAAGHAPQPADDWGAGAERPAPRAGEPQRRLREGSVPVTGLAARLGRDPTQVAELLGHRRVSRQEVDGVLLVPLWQFTVDGELLEGAEDLVGAFPGDAASLAEWVTRPCRRLAGDVPLALLLQGRAAAVTAHVRGMARP